MKGQMTDKLRVQHILDAIAETEKYLTGITFEEFSQTRKNDLPPLNKLK